MFISLCDFHFACSFMSRMMKFVQFDVWIRDYIDVWHFGYFIWFLGSFQGDTLLRAAMMSNLEDHNVLEWEIDHFVIFSYWKSCLASQNLSINFDELYDRLRSYGYGETFIKNEGVIGDILRDVNRTFPTHCLFKNSGGLGQLMLENVLRCISECYTDIGYCQVRTPWCD